jgi:flagellar hook-length control protein FliK
MALSSASAASPTPAVDTTAKANISIAGTGNGSTAAFADSLEAVLAAPGAARAAITTNTDSDVTPFASSNLAKLKSRLMNSDAAAAMAPQALQQQDAVQQKLDATNTGIDLPALRAAMGKSARTPGMAQIMPVVNPLTGQITSARTDTSTQTKMASPAFANTATTPVKMSAQSNPANPALANTVTAQIIPAQSIATPQAAASMQQDVAVNTMANNAGLKNTPASPSQPAVPAATQAKLVAGLIKTAEAPVLKTGRADGSTVPNTKIAHHTKTEKAGGTETLQLMAAKIAATAAIASPDDTAQTAAKSVAAAEVSTRTAVATATPSVTKIEAAAMATATQAAVHAPTPPEKIEAQALPVQFDIQGSKQDRNADTKSGTDGKDQSQSGSARTASDVSQKTEAPATSFADNTQPSPAPSHTNATPANNNTAAANNSTIVSTPATPPQIATTLQVSPQPQHSTPSDEATFAALGVAIAAKSKDGEKQFDINMHPAELGRVDVRISVDAVGKAQAHLSAEHPQTLQLLQNDKATLERNLRDAGLDVANNGLSFSLKGEQQSSTPTFNARSRALSIATVQTTDISSIHSSSSIAPGDSRLDIRV